MTRKYRIVCEVSEPHALVDGLNMSTAADYPHEKVVEEWEMPAGTTVYGVLCASRTGPEAARQIQEWYRNMLNGVPQ